MFRAVPGLRCVPDSCTDPLDGDRRVRGAWWSVRCVQGSVQQRYMCGMHRLFRASSSAYLLINSEMLERASAEGLASYSEEMEKIWGFLGGLIFCFFFFF